MTTPATKLTTGDGRETNVANIAKLYKDINDLSIPTAGKITKFGPTTYSITGYFETIDCDNLEKLNTFKVYSLSTGSKDGRCIESVQCISEAHPVSELCSATSNNGRFLARLKASPGEQRKQSLEIWDRSRLLKTIDLSELAEHGQIDVSKQFSNFTWSPHGDQDKLLYVCQSRQPKHMSFFKPFDLKKLDSVGDVAREDAVAYGEQYTKKEDWGECLNGIDHTLVAILDVANDFKVTVLNMDGLSLAKPQWLKDNRTVSVAYKEEPRRLGAIFCNNKPSKIVIHDWSQSTPTEVYCCAEEGLCFHTPRVNNAGDEILFLSNKVLGAHLHASRLHLLKYGQGEPRKRLLVDEVTGQSEFFIVNFPSNCFSMDDKYILFDNVADHLYNHMCLFDLEKSILSTIKFPTAGLSVLDFRYDMVLARSADINVTPTLFVGALDSRNYGELVAWHQIEDCILFDEIEYETYKIPILGESSFVSALLVSPKVELLGSSCSEQPDIERESRSSNKHSSQLPTIVNVHGGPHSAYTVAYYKDVVLFARLGIKTLCINYRGSTGVDEAYSSALCGNIGRMDVDDCMSAVRHLSSTKVIDPNKLIISGGSHGGFLAIHLSCQTEFKFTSAIIRNPVVNLATLYATSDIPEWCFEEGLGGGFSFDAVPTVEQQRKLFECSPISKVESACVPTLMLLGSNDRRVNMFQGERWVDLLKTRGVKVSCKIYPDEHQLRKPEVAADCSISAIIFALSNLR